MAKINERILKKKKKERKIQSALYIIRNIKYNSYLLLSTSDRNISRSGMEGATHKFTAAPILQDTYPNRTNKF